MKLPINWLREYIDFSGNPQELIDKLTSIGHMQDGPAKQIAGDTVYDLETRQNRSDCFSIIGLAREAAAILNKKIKYPASFSKKLAVIKGQTKIEIADTELCYRFNTVTIDGIKVGQTPDWIFKKLEAYGIKSINNLVDITNFVMVETGQPLHAFDQQKVTDSHLIIRSANEKEKMKVLGAKEIELSKEDLVIADPQKVLALAGVIGGEESGVTEKTTSIILEAATYNQASIRRTSLRHQIRTEASTRLEKFLHPHLTELALQRAVDLILEICGGRMINHSDSYPKKFADKKIPLNIDNLKKLGGIDIDEKTAWEILERLEITKTIPYFRTDLEQEADLIEEVLRIYGYEKIPERLPGNAPGKQIQSNWYDLEEKIRDAMTGFGFDEEITDPLTNEENSEHEPVKLENSLNSDKMLLRTTLKNSLENALTFQKKYRKQAINLFEIGKIYSAPNKEQRTLGILSHGKDSYLKLKGAIEALFEKIGYYLELNNLKIESLSPSAHFAELAIEQSFTKKIKPRLHTSPPQLVLEDLSFFIPKGAPVDEIIRAIKNTSPIIHRVDLGENPQPHDNDQKTLFLKLAFLSGNIKALKEKIIEKLSKDYKAQLR